MKLKDNLIRYIDAGNFPIIYIKSNEELKISALFS